MIGNITNRDFRHCQPTHPLTLKNTVMGQRTPGHSKNKVSNVVVKVSGEQSDVLFLVGEQW